MMIKCCMKGYQRRALNESGAESRAAAERAKEGEGGGVVELEAESEQEGEMQGSVRWEKAAMVGGGELNIQQLRPDSLTRGFHVVSVPPEVDGNNA